MIRRQRGTGRIFLPKGSSVWWLQYYQNGVKRRESAETSNRKEALEKLKLRIAELTTGSVTGLTPKKTRISELAEDFIRDYKINGRSSLDDAETRWRLHLEPFFGRMKASQVTSVLLNKYVDKRQQAGAANGTINRELAALKRMFNLGHQATPPRVFFIPHFPKLTESNARQGFLEDAQYQRLLESCPEIWFQALVEAGCTYGWRIGELLKLRVNQIDLENQVIRLHPGTTKNKEGREVTMTQAIHDLFELCVEGKEPEEFLFTRPNGKNVRDFRDAWDKARMAAGVPTLLFHDLRRTAARNFRRAGIAEGVIMKIGGWKTRSVFERYAIVSHSDIEDALQKLELRKSASKRITSVIENQYGKDKPRLILVSSRKA
jgi:integrase